MSAHSRATAGLRLVIVIALFPAFFVYLFPQLGFVAAFYDGDRSQWLRFWAAAAVFEWCVLAVILSTYAGQREALREIGLPKPRPATLLTAAGFLGIAVWAALALPGVMPATLERMPYGATLFLPPADTASRLFWVFMSFTAAICEETLFRGVAIRELQKLTGSLWIAVLVSSLAFSFFHGGVGQGMAIFAVRFAVALVLAGLFLWRKRLTSAMAVHFALDVSALAAV